MAQALIAQLMDSLPETHAALTQAAVAMWQRHVAVQVQIARQIVLHPAVLVELKTAYVIRLKPAQAAHPTVQPTFLLRAVNVEL